MTKTDEELGDINRLAYAECQRWLVELNDVSQDDAALAEISRQMNEWFLHLGEQERENPDSKYRQPFVDAQMAIQSAQSILGTIQQINDSESGSTRAGELLMDAGVALRQASAALAGVGPV